MDDKLPSSEPEIVDDTRGSSPQASEDERILHPRSNGVNPRASGPSGSGRGAMAPPALPARFKVPTKPRPSDDYGAVSPPPATFAVRAPGAQTKKRLHPGALDSSPLVSTPTSRRRLHRQRSQEFLDPSASPRPAKKKKRKFADVVEAQRHNPWIDVEASHSGDENSAGGSEDDEAMDEEDRQFIAENPTQASPSYDQSAVYRRSLMTQVPGGSMPAFANRPIRRGGAVYGGFSRPQARQMVSSSPPREEGSDDFYEFGSFVVDDEEEISYADDSQRLSDL